jgi:hypothetical protein
VLYNLEALVIRRVWFVHSEMVTALALQYIVPAEQAMAGYRFSSAEYSCSKRKSDHEAPRCVIKNGRAFSLTGHK